MCIYIYIYTLYIHYIHFIHYIHYREYSICYMLCAMYYILCNLYYILTTYDIPLSRGIWGARPKEQE